MSSCERRIKLLGQNKVGESERHSVSGKHVWGRRDCRQAAVGLSLLIKIYISFYLHLLAINKLILITN